MKVLLLTFLALFGYCVGVPARENGGTTYDSDDGGTTYDSDDGGTTYDSSEGTTYGEATYDDHFIPSVTQRKSSSASTCYIVLLHHSTTRYLVDPKGEAEEPYVCAAVPCDASGHLTEMAIILAESKGSESMTVSPDSFDTSYENLYQNEDLCMAGRMGGATVTCKASTSDSVLMLLEEKLDSLLPHEQQSSFPVHQDTTDSELKTQSSPSGVNQDLQPHDAGFISSTYEGGISYQGQQTTRPKETVDSQWQNSWDRPLSFSCRGNQALYRVKSTHSNRKEDRVWEWSCRTVLKGNTRFQGSDCKWTGWQNGYDLPLMFQCPANKVLTGVKSIHHNGKEDRVWAFQCCSAKDYYTRNCYLSNWINDWDRSMDHRVSSPQVFTGAYSYHNNRHEDRRWKIMACDYTNCRGV